MSRKFDWTLLLINHWLSSIAACFGLFGLFCPRFCPRICPQTFGPTPLGKLDTCLEECRSRIRRPLPCREKPPRSRERSDRPDKEQSPSNRPCAAKTTARRYSRFLLPGRRI